MSQTWLSAFASGKASRNESWQEEIAIQVVQGMHQVFSSMANSGIVVGAQVKFKY
jgi:hypothetical protein